MGCCSCEWVRGISLRAGGTSSTLRGRCRWSGPTPLWSPLQSSPTGGRWPGLKVWEFFCCIQQYLTIGSGDQLQVLAVVGHQPLDQVNLLQGDLHRVLVLGPTGGVGHPQLRWFCRDEKSLSYLSSNFSLDQSGYVSVGPLWGSPRGDLRVIFRVVGDKIMMTDLAEVGAKVDRLDLVVDKLSDVPRQIVVPGF